MYTEYLLKLKLSQGFTNLQLLKVVKFIVQEKCVPNDLQLLDVARISLEKRDRVQKQLAAEDLSHKVILHMQQTKVLTILDAQYPQRLRETYNSPVVLFYQGDIQALNQVCLGVVGARDCTKYADLSVKKILGACPSNISVISGLAMGVDRIAHQTALAYGLKTIAVIGSGLNRIYPKQNMALQQQVGSYGLLISEYPLDTTPRPYHFPARNRIIAGLSHGLLIVEAKEKSGSLITASLALENNRSVFAIPGNIFSPLSKGTNQLIQAGATPVENATDILNELTYYG